MTGTVDERPFSSAYDAETGVLAISGSIDELSGVALRDSLEKESAGYSRPLVVDLNDVDFLPSLGVGVLAVARENARKAGHELEFVARRGCIAQRVLEICGLPYREA
ncbi:STAS domain-containing protein [Nocardioides ferulae]|uniref:STAS domain-containing protein n=1 Tax=Nocardioides ferulae TaxID=2340821 RepID=UPI000EB259C3|nr:STAS domain-containing protein [Nocardioides ferulae]